MLKLYCAARTCAPASHIAPEQTGAGCEAVRIFFKTPAQFFEVGGVDPARFAKIPRFRNGMAGRPAV